MKAKTRELLMRSRELNADTLTPVTIFSNLVGSEPGFLLESRESGKGRYSFIGRSDTFITWGEHGVSINGQVPFGEDLFASLQELLDAVELAGERRFPFEGGLVGSLGYDAVRLIERIPDANPDPTGIPAAHFMVSLAFVAFDHLHGTIHLVVLHEPGETDEADQTLSEMERSLHGMVQPHDGRRYETEILDEVPDADTFMDSVRRVKRHVVDGDVFQTVLSRRRRVRTEKPPFEVYRSLRAINPSPYLFYLNFGPYQILGSSPEMLVEKRGRRIRTCPIAGTRRRGESPEQDEALAKELLADAKEVSEHMMLVDLGRNDMGHIASCGSVHMDRLMEIQKFSHVMHIVSRVQGELTDGVQQTEMIKAFFPAGTLSGAPKIRAMDIIDDLETEKRSFYGGAVGYLSYNGDVDLCITIRSMLMKQGVATVQAGAGIVLDSDPMREYEETQNKLGAVMRALG